LAGEVSHWGTSPVVLTAVTHSNSLGKPDVSGNGASVGRMLRFLGCGLLMGAADVVPGVSGGTVALVLGIYRRLVDAVRGAARVCVPLARGHFGRFWVSLRSLDFAFLVPLGIGILLAVGSLARPIETQLHNNPEEAAGVFFGLVAASVIFALRLINQPGTRHFLVMVGVGVLLFVLLGYQSGPVSDPAPVVLLGSGALAICAMILPGISGSFILLMIGMYAAVIGVISGRDFSDVAFFAVGAAFGLALFSQALGWVLAKYHDLVTAIMIGLMLGSLRVLWPWPNGVGVISDVEGEVIDGTGLAWPSGEELVLPSALAVVAAGLVWGLTSLSNRFAQRV